MVSERMARVMTGALEWMIAWAEREVRRREKMVGRGRCDRIRDWISAGREKKR
jgi:hypothetical protein